MSPAAQLARFRRRLTAARKQIRELIAKGGQNAGAVASLSLVEKLLLKR